VVFVGLKLCIKPAQVAHGSGPAQGLNIIYVDMPSGEVDGKYSSYDLAIFLLEPAPLVSRSFELRPEALVRASGSYGPT
jgi:hypothetical protein